MNEISFQIFKWRRRVIWPSYADDTCQQFESAIRTETPGPEFCVDSHVNQQTRSKAPTASISTECENFQMKKNALHFVRFGAVFGVNRPIFPKVNKTKVENAKNREQRGVGGSLA